MSVVDGPETPVGVVIGTGAGTERPHCQETFRRPITSFPHTCNNHIISLGIKSYSKTFSMTGFQMVCSAILVQKGAVCQCWLSWVKQVRPGMLQVSLLRSLLISLRSFFLRFCSFISHCFFCLEGILLSTHSHYRHRQRREKHMSQNSLQYPSRSTLLE